jgi:LysR family transcriptional regulator, low CO2-responsive transcriptional regulator
MPDSHRSSSLLRSDRSEGLQLPHLETFSNAAELNSFTLAARRLGLTQAAVSQRIHVLERALKVSLFRRRGGRVILTEAGQRLHAYAQSIFALHRQARQEVAGQKLPVSGQLSLAASTIPGEHFLPALLSVFHKRYPHIEVKADISDSMGVISQVEKGLVSLGLVGRKTDNPHLDFRLFAHDRMVLVVPSRHAWSRRRRVSLQQLCTQPLILRESGSGLRHCFEKELGRLDKSVQDLKIALELGSNEAIKEAILRGVGLAVLSSYAVQKELEAGRLHALKVSGLHCDREMFVVTDRRRVQSLPAQTFLMFLESNPVPAPAS